MLRRALISPRLWLLSVILWAITLFLLSSLQATPHVDGPEIPHMDKVMHFVYFMGGAFLSATHQLLKSKGQTEDAHSFGCGFGIPAA